MRGSRRLFLPSTSTSQRPASFHAHGFHRGRGEHRGAQLAERALHGLRHLLVFEGHELGQVLHDGDLHAPRGGVEVGELAADGPRAHDDHRLGQAVERQGVLRREDMHAVDGHERHLARTGTRGEDDVVGLVARAVHIDAACAREASVARDQVDCVLLEQELHALAHGFGHAPRAGHDLRRVGTHGALQFQPVVGGILAVGVDLGALEQRLGGDAAPVEAYAADVGAFDHGDLAAQLRGHGWPRRIRRGRCRLR